MSNKSKVTSIRVDAELYDKFKDIVAEDGKQVSAVMNKMIEEHIERHDRNIADARKRNDRIVAGLKKLDGQIDWTKVSDFTISSISNRDSAAYPKFIDQTMAKNIIEKDKIMMHLMLGTGFDSPVIYILETDNSEWVDLLIVEPKKQDGEVK